MSIVSKNILQIDAVVQVTLLIPMLLCYLLYGITMTGYFYVFGVLLELALALVQIVSGMAYSVLYNNKARKLYLIVSIVYVVLLLVIFNIGNYIQDPYIWLVSISILPAFIAGWYFWITINDLRSGNFEH